MKKTGENNYALQYEALRQFIRAAGMKYIEFADLAGINRSSFQTMLSKESSMKTETFTKIIKAMDKIFSGIEEGTEISKELSILSLIFTIPRDDLPEIIREASIEVFGSPKESEKVGLNELLKSKALNRILNSTNHNHTTRKKKSNLILSRKSHSIESDKAVRIVCNMDSALYNLVVKSAEKNNRTFEDELEEIVYWSFEDYNSNIKRKRAEHGND